MKSQLVDRDNPVLRETAQAVPLDEITSAKIKKIIERMKETLHKEEDGVAIAAPQIGEGLRIFVTSGRALMKLENEMDIEPTEVPKDDVFINPEITKLSRKKTPVEEGCLSLRWLYGKVNRSEKATIRAYDENGNKFERGGTGLMAQIFQHEVDHLNGILFIDKATDVKDFPPDEKHSS